MTSRMGKNRHPVFTGNYHTARYTGNPHFRRLWLPVAW